MSISKEHCCCTIGPFLSWNEQVCVWKDVYFQSFPYRCGGVMRTYLKHTTGAGSETLSFMQLMHDLNFLCCCCGFRMISANEGWSKKLSKSYIGLKVYSWTSASYSGDRKNFPQLMHTLNFLCCCWLSYDKCRLRRTAHHWVFHVLLISKYNCFQKCLMSMYFRWRSLFLE